MKAAQPQREHPKSNLVSSSRKARRQVAAVARPLSLPDATSPALRLGHGVGPARTEKALPEEKTPDSVLQQVRQTYFAGQVTHATRLVQQSLGAGQPLPTTVRSEMSKHYRQDFSAVRVHNDEFSAQATRALDVSQPAGDSAGKIQNFRRRFSISDEILNTNLKLSGGLEQTTEMMCECSGGAIEVDILRSSRLQLTFAPVG